MTPTLAIAVIADDLTGAADTGIQFLPVAGPVDLLASPSQAAGFPLRTAGGVAVFTDTRHASPEQAAARVREAARAIAPLAPGIVYHKIDSCLRGNPGAELDALLEVLGRPFSLVAPALPAQGRATANDLHTVRGIPVAESEIGRDPRCPVRESRLTRAVARQSRLPVGHAPLAAVAAGPDALAAAVAEARAAGARHVACDAVTDAHLAVIAAAARAHFPAALLCGSAGLAAGLAQVLGRGPTPPPAGAPPRLRRMLWVCGSASEVLQRQLAALAARTGVRPRAVPAGELAATSDPARFRSLARELAAGWERGLRVLAVAPGVPAADPARVVEGLAAAACAVVERVAPEGLLLTGGDTAAALWRRLGAQAVRMEAEALPGIMRGRWVGGGQDGRTVVTKAGAFGAPETLCNLHDQLLET